MNMTNMQYAWAIYFAGAFGCTMAAWWMFLWAWRFVRYTAVVTVMTLLFTPYAIDPQTMTMAPAIYTLVFEGVAQGFTAIKPLVKVMVGIWLIAEILVLVFVVLTWRSRSYTEPAPEHSSRRLSSKSSRRQHDQSFDAKNTHAKSLHKNQYNKNQRSKTTYKSRPLKRDMSDEEYEARNELMAGEIPIRAIRD